MDWNVCLRNSLTFFKSTYHFIQIWTTLSEIYLIKINSVRRGSQCVMFFLLNTPLKKSKLERLY